MKIILAPDSYKGSLSAFEVCKAMKKGISKVLPDAEIILAPMADGGEGTVKSLVDATGGKIVSQKVTGPLGNEIPAFFGILGDGCTAVIEMAAASGLTLIPAEKRDPRITTTYGTGELITAALRKGCTKLIIGLGGSATNDGGAGMAQALGFRFLDQNHSDLPLGGAALINLAHIECPTKNFLHESIEIIGACDVINPLTGPEGASVIYGPQKGATPEIVIELDQALKNFAVVVSQDLKTNIDFPGSGAAGGLGGGLAVFLGATLQSGTDIVMDTIKLAERMKGADLVITGEGRLDLQTINGKTPIGVAKLAKKYALPVLAIAGSIGCEAEVVYQHGIDGITSIIDQPMTLDEALANAGDLIASATERMVRVYFAGINKTFIHYT